MKQIMAALLALTVFLPASGVAGDKIKGTYEVIGSAEKLKGAKHIEMIEFFNFSCGHCYRFLKTSKNLKAKYKDKLQHKKYPIYWGNQTPYPAMA
ncbi:MAG: disulfide bond formation protein DsbA, partial [Nitrospinota bacterium]|nr:disulfide bond formation protein DsbA [Nitrospinota bacterium]